MVSWMMSIKAVLISSGVASMAFLLKVSVPVAVDFSVSQAPILWSSLLSWLKPPYVYVLTNGIIITIVASSRYYRGNGHFDREEDEIGYNNDYKIQTVTEQVIHQNSPRTLEVKDAETGAHIGFVATTNPSYVEEFVPEVVTEEMVRDAVAVIEDEDEIEEEVKNVLVVKNPDLIEISADEEIMAAETSKLNHLPPSMVTESENLPPIDKPPVSSRFSHRKPAKTGPEAAGRRALRVTKPKKHDTLENTWKMITEGKSTSLTKHYRRSDTLSHGDSDAAAEAKPVYKKSETFKDRTNHYQSREVKKETSPSQDELNRRVEAFIQKFNEEMKLQRMESLRQYKEITGREV